MKHRALFLSTFLLACSSVPFAGDSVLVGGAGAKACSNTLDPPTLADGVTLASAKLDFEWDAVTRVLSLTVENTSEVKVGIPNPLITQIYFNLPSSAIANIQLLSQVGSGGAGSPIPAFAFDYDLDVPANRSLKSGCTGAFGARLAIQGIQGGIANANADLPGGPGGAAVVGPVTFQFLVDGPGVQSLIADTFASGFSYNPPGTYNVNAAIHFQSGGVAGASDKLSNAPGCEPSGWMIGELEIGQPVTFTQSAAPGCHGCMGFSFSEGPTQVGLLSVPLGNPIRVIFPGLFPASGQRAKTATLPDDPSLVGRTAYFAVITRSPLGIFEVSAAFSAVIGQ